MDDVLPPNGGYILIEVDTWGYMRHDLSVVHRETRDLQESLAWCESFLQAKEQLVASPSHEGAILELTPEGGGAIVWTLPEREEMLAKRLARWRGCYGNWPIRTLSI